MSENVSARVLKLIISLLFKDDDNVWSFGDGDYGNYFHFFIQFKLLHFD